MIKAYCSLLAFFLAAPAMAQAPSDVPSALNYAEVGYDCAALAMAASNEATASELNSRTTKLVRPYGSELVTVLTAETELDFQSADFLLGFFLGQAIIRVDSLLSPSNDVRLPREEERQVAATVFEERNCNFVLN